MFKIFTSVCCRSLMVCLSQEASNKSIIVQVHEMRTICNFRLSAHEETCTDFKAHTFWTYPDGLKDGQIKITMGGDNGGKGKDARDNWRFVTRPGRRLVVCGSCVKPEAFETSWTSSPPARIVHASESGSRARVSQHLGNTPYITSILTWTLPLVTLGFSLHRGF